MNRKVLYCLLFACTVALASLAWAEDKKAGAEGAKPDEAAMMAEYMKMIAPGPEHEAMAKHVGNWTSVNKMWMDPKAPPMESKGSESCKMIMGGRVCQSEYKGDMMGMSFEGQGTMGYDKFKKQYWMTWIDNMGTSVSTAWGTASADGKTITMTGKMDDPMTGKMNKDVKYITKIQDDDHYTFEIWDEVGTPAEFKVMEMTYTRAK